MAVIIKSVDHAMNVLFAVAASRGENITLSSIGHQVGLPLANVLRFLRTLERHGLVVRNEKREVMLGFGAMALGAAFQPGAAIGPISVTYLRQLRDITGETTALQVALGNERACIQQVVSNADVKWAVEPGRRFPLITGAAGKVLTAFLPDEERRTIIDRASRQSAELRTTSDLAAFNRELASVRRDGFALSIDGTVIGASAVAAPVRDHTGRVVAAMTVAGPTDRLPRTRLLKLARHLVSSASRLSVEFSDVTGGKGIRGASRRARKRA